jgi:hypothetical protein
VSHVSDASQGCSRRVSRSPIAKHDARSNEEREASNWKEKKNQRQEIEKGRRRGRHETGKRKSNRNKRHIREGTEQILDKERDGRKQDNQSQRNRGKISKKGVEYGLGVEERRHTGHKKRRDGRYREWVETRTSPRSFGTSQFRRPGPTRQFAGKAPLLHKYFPCCHSSDSSHRRRNLEMKEVYSA